MKFKHNWLLIICAFLIAPTVFANEPFFGKISTIPDNIKQQMVSKTWEAGCPVPLDQLAYLQLSYWGFDNKQHLGELIVHKQVANETVDIFKRLYNAHFPIEKMILPENIVGNKKFNSPVDMMNYIEAEDDTSAFFCRIDTQSPKKLSPHSFGIAVDINPFFNPAIIAQGKAEPANASKYLDRNAQHIGMINEGDFVFTTFLNHGWIWGGFFSNGVDYMHFQKLMSPYYTVDKIEYNPLSKRIKGLPIW